MRDLEAYARTEKAEISGLVEESREPIALPSIEDLIALSQDAKKLMVTDVDRGREMLRRYLADGVIRCALDDDGPFASCNLGAHILLSDMQGRNRRIPGSGSSPRDSQVFAKSSGGKMSPAPGKLLLRFVFLIHRKGSPRFAAARRLVNRTPKT